MTYNADLFDRASAAYDEDPPFFRPLGEALARFSPSLPTDHVLDVGAGKGAVTLPLLRGMGGRGRVSAVDVSEQMVQVLSSYGLPSLDAQVADVTALPFADATFDHAVSGFCLHIVADLPAALREIRRALVPGGTLSWSMPGTHPDAAEWQEAYAAIFATFQARLPGTPPEMESTGADAIEDTFAPAGFALSRSITAPTVIPVGGAEDYWDWTQSHGARWLTDALAEHDPDAVVELRDAVLTSLRTLHPTGGADIMVSPRFFCLEAR